MQQDGGHSYCRARHLATFLSKPYLNLLMTRLPSAAADIHHPCRLYRIQAYAGWEATAPPAGDKERRDSIDMPGAALGAVLANSSNRWFRRAHDRAKTRRREITRVGSCSFSHSFSRRHSEGSDPPNAAVGLKEGSRVFDCSQRKLRSQDTVDQLVSFGQTGKLSLEHSSKEEELAQFKTDALEMRRRLKRMQPRPKILSGRNCARLPHSEHHPLEARLSMLARLDLQRTKVPLLT